MQIKNILTHYSGLGTQGRSSTPAAAGASRTTAAISPASGASSSAAAQKILSQYDVKNISPQEFSDMLQKLHQAGAVSSADFQSLSAIPGELEKEGTSSDQRVNLVQIYTDKLQQLQTQNPTSSGGNGQTAAGAAAAPAQRCLQLLQKFAMSHATPNGMGLNTVG
jgi:hypothetical protein